MDTITDTYRARLSDVIDGDTVDLTVDLGFRVTKTVRIRLYGVETAEIYGEKEGSDERQRGLRHKAETDSFMHPDGGGDWPFIVEIEEESKRRSEWLGTIYNTSTGESLNEHLRETFDDVSIHDPFR